MSRAGESGARSCSPPARCPGGAVLAGESRPPGNQVEHGTKALRETQRALVAGVDARGVEAMAAFEADRAEQRGAALAQDSARDAAHAADEGLARRGRVARARGRALETARARYDDVVRRGR